MCYRASYKNVTAATIILRSLCKLFHSIVSQQKYFALQRIYKIVSIVLQAAKMYIWLCYKYAHLFRHMYDFLTLSLWASLLWKIQTTQLHQWVDSDSSRLILSFSMSRITKSLICYRLSESLTCWGKSLLTRVLTLSYAMNALSSYPFPRWYWNIYYWG